MNEEYIVDVDNLTIRFNMASEKVDNLKEYVIKLIKHELMFQEFLALKDVNLKVKRGEAWGLIGTNGAGKSTTLRIMTGIMKPDAGEALVDEEPVYRNVGRKERITFIPDEPYFFSSATPVTMAQYYASIYPAFEMAQFYEWLDKFGLEKT